MREKNQIKVCPECGKPLIWTFAFAYREYLCLNCGYCCGMMSASCADETKELKYTQKIYQNVWKVLYNSGWFLPLSDYTRNKCKKCGKENHNKHLSETEKIKDKIAKDIYKKLIKV